MVVWWCGDGDGFCDGGIVVTDLVRMGGMIVVGTLYREGSGGSGGGLVVLVLVVVAVLVVVVVMVVMVVIVLV